MPEEEVHHATIQGAIDAAATNDTIIDGFSLVNGSGTLNPFNFQSGGHPATILVFIVAIPNGLF